MCHQEGLELNGTHQILFNADDFNILDEILDIMKKNTEALLEASREDRLEVNTEKTEYVVVSRHQNSWQYHNLLTFFRSVQYLSSVLYLKS
jgi:hypothetical protein